MKTNPGGIILIAIGVLLLNLAYTGRARTVWDAIRGGSSEPVAEAASAGNETAEAATGGRGSWRHGH